MLRWVIPDDLLASAGEATHAPALLQQLLDDSTLCSARVGGGGVLTPLGTDHDRRTKGVRVRSVPVDVLGAPKSWKSVVTAHASGPDNALGAATRQITDGFLGAFVNSHGGAFVIHSVRDGVAEIVIKGACNHCLAAKIAMHVRFEHLLRRRCLWLVKVHRIDEQPLLGAVRHQIGHFSHSLATLPPGCARDVRLDTLRGVGPLLICIDVVSKSRRWLSLTSECHDRYVVPHHDQSQTQDPRSSESNMMIAASPHSTAIPTGVGAAPSSTHTCLFDLRLGTSTRVIALREDTAGNPISQQLSDLGFVSGRTVTPLRRVPLGDPVVYHVVDYELCLRRHEVRMIHIEVLTEAGFDIVKPLIGQRTDSTEREEQRP